MSPLKQSNNIAARMGRWSASHWKTAVFGWLAFVVVAVAVGMAVGTKKIDQQDANVGQSHRADQILKHAGFQADPQTEIVARPEQDARRSTTRRSARRSTTSSRRSKPFATIKNLRSPLDPAHGDQVSADGHTALVEFDMKGTQTGRRRSASTRSPTATAAVAKRASRASTSARPARSAPARRSTRCSTSSSRRPASGRSR